MSLFRQDQKVDICCIAEELICNTEHRQTRVKRPLKSFRNIHIKALWILNRWNKHLSWLADHNREPPFQAELPSLWIKVHEDWYSADSTGVDPRKRSHRVPVYFTCQMYYM